MRSLNLEFPGTTAVVTGGLSGIGQATTSLLRSCGLRVVAVDLATSSELDDVQVDISDELELENRLMPRIVDGGVDYLVNCAGIHEQSSIAGTGQASWHRMLDVNLVAPATLVRLLRPHLNAGGAVVNITSLEATRVVALVNPEPVPHYAASKAGLEMLTRSMARDLAPRGIRVNAVAPGFVQTPMAANNHHGSVDLPDEASRRVPLGRYASAEEVASVAAFLLSNGASYITGSSILVDGGFSTS